MDLFIIGIFILGYFAITIEHVIKVDKLVPALITMTILWAIIALGIEDFPNWFDPGSHGLVEGFLNFPLEEKQHLLENTLLHHLGKTSEILIFLIGAMTIVEIIDHFNGFAVIRDLIKFKSKIAILWVFSILAFVLSAIIDNLTATIVLISILQKLVSNRSLRLWYAGLIVIAANAGGAWSPIGDVTTTMLWIGKKVTTPELISHLLIPSIVCMVVSSGIASLLPVFKGNITLKKSEDDTRNRFSRNILIIGLLAIISVPVFKIVTHLPPYIGMMLGLGVVSIFAEIYSNSKFGLSEITSSDHDELLKSSSHVSPVHNALSKIELPSILFFLGILMAVAALESLGILFQLALDLKQTISLDTLVIIMGIASAIIDNVPLVAASLGMFTEPIDDQLWHFIAYSAGTGGSMLIIGSAAGVVAMGMEKINFFWYLKKIGWIAFLGFISGAATFMILRNFI
jgi:Na+/H+ antiporter NhaD/arsenite permease-like protein|tara:strand:+ start:1024 stop:2394 length:1371 start_codon:yes stop_codon:yes gene_type:complete